MLKHRQRHVFILSENGKPIYTRFQQKQTSILTKPYLSFSPSSRFGDEDHLITMMGVIQAIVSLAETTESNELNFIKAGRSRISFLHRDPLTFVLVTYNDEPSCLLTQQLFYVYHQLISILTKTRIHHMYKNRPSFDLRRWLSSTEKQMFNNILDVYENDLGLLFESVQVLPLQMTTRSLLDLIIVEKVRQNNVRFNQVGKKSEWVHIDFVLFRILLLLWSSLEIISCHWHVWEPSQWLQLIFIFWWIGWEILILVKDQNSGYRYVCLYSIQGETEWGRKSVFTSIFHSFFYSGTFHSHISSLDDSGIVKLVLLSISAGDFSSVSNLRQEIKKVSKEKNKLDFARRHSEVNTSEILLSRFSVVTVLEEN